MATLYESGWPRAGLAMIAGAAITVLGGTAAQIARGVTTVPDQAYQYPWSHDAFVVFSVIAAASHVLIFAGLLGLRRSRATGTTRGANLGLILAMAGTALLFLAELASIPIANQSEGEAGPAIVDGSFGLASLLTATGMVLAGSAAVRARVWSGWRRFTPLACGIWSVVLIPLSFTSAVSAGVAVYGLCFLALGVALAGRSSSSPVVAPPAQEAP